MFPIIIGERWGRQKRGGGRKPSSAMSWETGKKKIAGKIANHFSIATMLGRTESRRKQTGTTIWKSLKKRGKGFHRLQEDLKRLVKKKHY